MSVFQNADEAYRYIGGVFEEAMADGSVGPRFAASGVVLQLTMREPDLVITVDMPAGVVERGAREAKPTVEIKATTETVHRFWLGKVNISVAIAKGEMRAKGPIQKIIQLVPIAKEMFPRYQALLAREGRDDLAAA